MIGTRAALSAVTAIIGLAVTLAPHAADPVVARAAERLVDERANAALRALEELAVAVAPGLDAARSAAAAVLTGDAPPGGGLIEAGAVISAAEEFAVAARTAVAELNVVRAAWHPGAVALQEPISAGELTSIGAQLGASADAADAFVEMRRRAVGVPSALEHALDALDREQLDEAHDLVVGARSDHVAIAAWEIGVPTLRVWISTMDAMISSVEAIIDALRDGDAAAAAVAGQAFAALGPDAATADRALRIALGEGGSAVTAAPLERLAVALGSMTSARDLVAAVAADSTR